MSDPYPSLYPHEEPTEQASGPPRYPYDSYLIPPPPPPRSHWKLWAGGVLALLLLVNALLVGYILGSHQGGQTVSTLPASNPPVSAVATTALLTPTQMPSPTPTPTSPPITPQTCTLHVTDHLMTMTITGQMADQDCNAILAGDPNNFLGQVGVEFYDEGIYLDPSTPDQSVVCDFYDQGRRITIRDGGGLYYGTKYCQALGH